MGCLPTRYPGKMSRSPKTQIVAQISSKDIGGNVRSNLGWHWWELSGLRNQASAISRLLGMTPCNWRSCWRIGGWSQRRNSVWSRTTDAATPRYYEKMFKFGHSYHKTQRSWYWTVNDTPVSAFFYSTVSQVWANYSNFPGSHRGRWTISEWDGRNQCKGIYDKIMLDILVISAQRVPVWANLARFSAIYIRRTVLARPCKAWSNSEWCPAGDPDVFRTKGSIPSVG
jgi:hypothetical protein